MKISTAVASRLAAQKAVPLISKPFAIISILDPDSDPPIFEVNPNFKNILALRFYDIDCNTIPCDKNFLGKYKDGLFTDEQAVSIIKFVEETLKKKVHNFLIHCEAGISRSAAVAAAIELIFNGSDRKIFDNKRYLPNMFVYRKLVNMWQNLKEKRRK